jgi:hypothetical protein
LYLDPGEIRGEFFIALPKAPHVHFVRSRLKGRIHIPRAAKEAVFPWLKLLCVIFNKIFHLTNEESV